jgi:hypothetical protein
MTGGSFSIASVKGGGTLARLSWPLTSSERRKRQRNRRLVASSS